MKLCILSLFFFLGLSQLAAADGSAGRARRQLLTGITQTNGFLGASALGYTPGMYLDQTSAAIKGALAGKQAAKSQQLPRAAPLPAAGLSAAPRPVVVLPPGQAASATAGAVATAGAGGGAGPFAAPAPTFNAAAPGAINVVTNTYVKTAVCIYPSFS